MDHQASTRSDLERLLSDEGMEAKALPLSLLKNITDDFSNNNEIVRGGFAVVYKGLLENGAVAVKKLSDMSVTDERRFLGEVVCLMKAKHQNIVRFLGYCSDTQGQWVDYNGKSVMGDVRQRLLCFEYLPNRSLDKYIKDASLQWRKCFQIIKGVCEGLHFLHNKNIVHSDLKPANILLDNDMVPKIADFGISRCFDGKQTHTATANITGSMGYLAPEVFYGKISFKSDIFSLGVIIIEILTGHKDYPDVKDVLKCWGHKVEKSLRDQVLELEQIIVCTEVGQSCLEYDTVKRPSAQDIIDILKQVERKERQIETRDTNRDTIRYAQGPSDRHAEQMYHGSHFQQDIVGNAPSSYFDGNACTGEVRVDGDSQLYIHGNQDYPADGDLLPGIEGFRIDGEPRLGSTLTACGYPTNGTTLCYFQWVHLENGIRQYIEDALKPDYVVTADDVGTLLAIDCTPFDDNGRHGDLVTEFANSGNKITCDPEMQSHIDACISSGRAEFQAFLLCSPEECELATLVLTRPSCQITLKHTGEVIVDDKYSPNLQPKIPNGRTTQFSVVSYTGANLFFTTKGLSESNLTFTTKGLSESNNEDYDVRLRDLIVLVIRTFQKKAIDAKRKGKAM